MTDEQLYSDEQPLVLAVGNINDGGPTSKKKPSKKNALKDFANVLKLFLGTNVLYQPLIFKNSGLVGGFALYLTVALIVFYAIRLLIEVKDALVQRNLEAADLSYEEICGHVFGKVGNFVVTAALFFTQAGFCISYCIYLGTNMAQLMDWPYAISCFVFTPFLYILTLFRDLRTLAPGSAVANAGILGSGVLCAVAILPKLLNKKHVLESVSLFKVTGLPVSFGLLCSTLEGIGMVLPVESSMKGNRHRFMAYIFWSVCIIVGGLGGFGIEGYLMYGENTADAITENVGLHSAVGIAARSIMMLGIVFTYPMQAYPMVYLSTQWIFKRPMGREPLWAGNILRLFLVLFTAAIASVVPHFGLFLGLIGALGSSTLAFILPVLMHLRIFWREKVLSTKLFDMLVFGLGIFAALFGTFDGVKNLINAYD